MKKQHARKLRNHIKREIAWNAKQAIAIMKRETDHATAIDFLNEVCDLILAGKIDDAEADSRWERLPKHIQELVEHEMHHGNHPKATAVKIYLKAQEDAKG